MSLSSLHLGLVVITLSKSHIGIIPSEIIGTALLILLGDGVVAAVLLAKSKAENPRDRAAEVGVAVARPIVGPGENHRTKRR